MKSSGAPLLLLPTTTAMPFTAAAPFSIDDGQCGGKHPSSAPQHIYETNTRAEGATCKTTTTTQALLLGDQPTNRSWEIILLIIPCHPSYEEGLKQSQLLIQYIGKYYVQSPESVHAVAWFWWMRTRREDYPQLSCVIESFR